MTALLVVKTDPLTQPLWQLGTPVEGMQVPTMVFAGLIKPFDKDVVHALAQAVQADGDERAGYGTTGIIRPFEAMLIHKPHQL